MLLSSKHYYYYTLMTINRENEKYCITILDSRTTAIARYVGAEKNKEKKTLIAITSEGFPVLSRGEMVLALKLVRALQVTPNSLLSR